MPMANGDQRAKSLFLRDVKRFADKSSVDTQLRMRCFRTREITVIETHIRYADSIFLSTKSRVQ
jgi:hypothetical protein